MSVKDLLKKLSKELESKPKESKESESKESESESDSEPELEEISLPSVSSVAKFDNVSESTLNKTVDNINKKEI